MEGVAKLHEAVEANDVTMVWHLIRNGTNVNVVYKQETAFTKAVKEEHYEAANVIMKSALFDPNVGNQFDRTPLFVVAQKGKTEYVKHLLTMGAQVDVADIRGVTPLAAASRYDHHTCARILIAHGANIDRTDVMGVSPLLRACTCVSKNVARLLIDNNCNVNLPAHDKSTPLTPALPSVYNYEVAKKKISDMLEICQMLVDAGCDINKEDGIGQTPLHRTVISNDIYGLCLLAENGCHLDVKDSNGLTPFQMAVTQKKLRYEAATFLLYFGANSQDLMAVGDGAMRNLVSPLYLVLNTSVPDGHHELAWSRTLLLQTLWRTLDPQTLVPQVQVQIPEGNISYHQTVETEIIKWLKACRPPSLQHQIRLQIRRWFQGTNMIPKISNLPIPNVLKKYLNLGLDGHCIPLSKICKLYIYIQDNNNEKVRELTESGAHIGIHIRQMKPLGSAFLNGNMEAAKILLKATPQHLLKRLNGCGDSVLHLVAKRGRQELLPVVMDKFKETNCINEDGFTALQEAMKRGNFNTAAGIIENDSNALLSSFCDIPILHIAAGSGQTHLVDLLLKKGQDPNMEDAYGNTPLHIAASKGLAYVMALPDLFIKRMTLEMDATSLTITNCPPKQPDSTAAFIQVINLLIHFGADLKRVNKISQTVLEWAIKGSDPVLIDFFKNLCDLTDKVIQ